MRVTCLLILVLLPAAFDPLSDFRGAFKRTSRPIAQLAARRSAFDAVKALNSPESTKALLSAIATLQTELRAIESMRDPILVAEGKRGRFQDLRSRMSLDPQRKLSRDLQAHVLQAAPGPTSLAMVRAAIKNRNLPFSFRLQILERHGSTLPRTDITKLLRSRKRWNRLLGLSAMTAGRIKLISLATPSLLSGSSLEQKQAVLALVRIKLPGSVKALVDHLSSTKDHGQRKVAASGLEALTGKRLGASPIAWERWWKDNASDPLAGQVSASKTKPKPKKKKAAVEQGDGYYGLPVIEGSVCFVLDNSQSMNAKLKGEYSNGAPTRISRAKTELKRVLQILEPGTRFNIVAFAREATAFSATMQTVRGNQIADAIKWVDALPLKLGTALYDGMDLAFRIAGRPHGDSYFVSKVDTFYVLTDGMPYRMQTDPEKKGLKSDDKKEILATVGEWNLMDQAVIHVIGMGSQIPHRFLNQLATENRGRYVRVK